MGDVQDQIASLLNEAKFANASDKIRAFKMARELLLTRGHLLIPDFIDEIMSFQVDQAQSVRREAISLGVSLCESHVSPAVLQSTLSALSGFAQYGRESGAALTTAKLALSGIITLYKLIFALVFALGPGIEPDPDLQQVWAFASSLQDHYVRSVLGAEATVGERVLFVAFIEQNIKLFLSSEGPAVEGVPRSQGPLPAHHSLLDPGALVTSAEETFISMVTAIRPENIECIPAPVAMAIIGTICRVARAFPRLYGKLVPALNVLATQVSPSGRSSPLYPRDYHYVYVLILHVQKKKKTKSSH